MKHEFETGYFLHFGMSFPMCVVLTDSRSKAIDSVKVSFDFDDKADDFYISKDTEGSLAISGEYTLELGDIRILSERSSQYWAICDDDGVIRLFLRGERYDVVQYVKEHISNFGIPSGGYRGIRYFQSHYTNFGSNFRHTLSGKRIPPIKIMEQT